MSGMVSEMLKAKGIANVTYLHRAGAEYPRLDMIEDASLDFALVDGDSRADCVRSVIPKLKPGAYLYLDNSDKHADTVDGDTRLAEKRILEVVKARNGTVRYFVDFVPTYVAVTEGLLARL